MQDYIRTLRMLNSTGTSYLDNISYMYYLYDSLGRLTLQGEYTGKNPSSSPTVLVQSYYDGYGFVGGTGLPTGQFTKDTSGYGGVLLPAVPLRFLAVALRSIRLSIMTSKGA